MVSLIKTQVLVNRANMHQKTNVYFNLILGKMFAFCNCGSPPGGKDG